MEEQVVKELHDKGTSTFAAQTPLLRQNMISKSCCCNQSLILGTVMA